MGTEFTAILLDTLCRSAIRDCREIIAHRADMFQDDGMAFRIAFKEQLVIDRANKIIQWGENNES